MSENIENKTEDKIYPEGVEVILYKQDGTKVINPPINKLNIKAKADCNNNILEIYEPFKTPIVLNISFGGSDSKVLIKENSKIERLSLILGDNTSISIGKDFSCKNTSITLGNDKNTSVTIGDDCMFSYEVLIRTSDAHSIYSIEDKKLLNPSENVIIGNHVWLCARTMVLKGSIIPSNTIVGACALVNKKFKKENCILAGTPAKIIKRNVNWSRTPPPQIYKEC